MLRVRASVASVVLPSLLILSACSDDGSPSGPGGEPSVATVSVSPGDATLTYFGETVALSAVALDASGDTIAGRTISWTSSDSSVVNVDDSGRATAMAAGEAAVRAMVGDVPGEANIAVVQTGAALAVIAGPDDGAAGESFDTPPAVEIRDAGGMRVSDDSETVVTASIESGGGELLGSVTATVEEGVATFADLAIGGAAGERTLRFSAPGVGHAESGAIDLGPGPAAALAVVSGDDQAGLADTDLAEPLVVSAVDAWGNGVAGVAIDWSTAAGGGRASSDSTGTDGEGRASVRYTLGRHAGEARIEAAASGLDDSPVVFTVTASPNGTISGTVSTTTIHLTSLDTSLDAGPDAVSSSSGSPGPGLVRPTTRSGSGPRPLGGDRSAGGRGGGHFGRRGRRRRRNTSRTS